MEKAIEWVKNHKPHTAVIVIVVVAVIAVLIAAASGAFTQQDKTNDAIENGDETLKGDAGTGILNKLDGNVNANPKSRARLPTSIRGNSTPRRSGCPTW